VVVQLPENSATLRVDVSAESGMIASYHWQQTGGPTINYDMHAENILVVENLTPGVYVFVVTVTDIDGQSTSEEIKITVLDENPEIRPRKLFSPDAKGDLTSETWTIENAHLLDGCEIVVYNREGQQVYSSIGYPVPWDGLSRGVPVPDGAYYYVIRRDGRVIKKGSVTIARLK
jgi:xyloglucan-specific exo-beta-1,4-glucanase